MKKVFKEETELNFIVDSKYEFLMSIDNVALAFCVNVEDINKDAFIEDKHYINKESIFFTKEGIKSLSKVIDTVRAVRFIQWIDKLSISSNKDDIERDLLKFYNLYGSLNPNVEFNIEFDDRKAKAYKDEQFGFFISTPELAVALNAGTSAIRAQKVYHKDKLIEGTHFIKLGKNNWWTMEGAKFIALRSKDNRFGKYLSSDELTRQLIITI